MMDLINTAPGLTMKDFVNMEGDKIVTDSFRVAKHFDKETKNVIRDIENKIKTLNKTDGGPEFAKLNFELCFEINELQNGKKQKFYRMTKDGFVLLTMGYTGVKAMSIQLAYIGAFNALATENKSLTGAIQQQIHDLSVRAAKSEAKGTFGSNLMHQRRREKPVLTEEVKALNAAIQPSLFIH
jgi:Rha family phage regulatory protein